MMTMQWARIFGASKVVVFDIVEERLELGRKLGADASINTREPDFMEKAMVGYADIASSPIDALAAMIGEKDVPKVIAQGVLDINELPAAGAELEVTVPLVRPLTGKAIGSITLVLR